VRRHPRLPQVACFLDPGVNSYLTQARGLTPVRVHHMVNHESGLLGVSDTSADMRDLLAHEASDPRAAEAVGLLCYQARKGIGAFAAALGGLDTLVFAGDIGEQAPAIRARACPGLSFLGIELDASLNVESAAVISAGASRVIVRVIRTDEELMIARSVLRARGFSGYNRNCLGITASDGPGPAKVTVDGGARRSLRAGRRHDRAVGGGRLAAIRARHRDASDSPPATSCA